MVKDFPYEGLFASLPRDDRFGPVQDRPLAIRLRALRLVERGYANHDSALIRRGFDALGWLLYRVAGLLDRVRL